MSITGFILDGAAGASTDREYAAYRSFSPDGAGTHFTGEPALYAGLPTCREQDLPDNVDQAAKVIRDLAARTTQKPRFLWARSILKHPRWYSDLAQRVAEGQTESEVVFVDPYTFFGLVRLNCSEPWQSR